ncbi:hypothetical protein BJY01DRAFT_233427 [Aspergillus pseudoustus]|uniref:Uncharacterized protein n=1 Tax=Aspergillus pseudoustus TaxID=1810923 RepID=A0ABR4KC94_9EURO
MPPSNLPQVSCPHSKITYTASPHAPQIGYAQPSLKERQDAMRPSPSSKFTLKISSKQLKSDLEAFPAPLVLPDDDLALDPEYPAQSFQEWYDEEERNPVTARRRTVYVVSPPAVESGIGGVDAVDVEGWMRPRKTDSQSMLAFPETQHAIDYLSAFYHGLPVKRLDLRNWKFTSWDEPAPKRTAKSNGKKTRNPHKNRSIGLATETECIRIRTRPCADGVYMQQLNLDDLLDAAISILPKDAYALCMLVHHDLFEDEDDTFVCGRAYGGSRVAVVSTARYNPLLDGVQGVERGHAWPAAHCARYVEESCRVAGSASKRRNKGYSSTQSLSAKKDEVESNGPLEAALAAYINSGIIPQTSQSESETTLWLWRISRTVSHELGHCFGVDHCVNYACIMQGSASLSEDTRQPPYLCPVDLAKVLAATGASTDERDRALLGFCEKEEWRDEPAFRAFAAWLRGSLDIQGSGSGDGEESEERRPPSLGWEFKLG